jgi:hypothetical protein
MNNILLFYNLLVLLVLSIYILFCYSKINSKTNELTTILDKRYASEYNIEKLSQLLKTCLLVLRKNAQTISQTYFYTQDIKTILHKMPEYNNVLNLVKYMNKYETKKDIKTLLESWYGINYANAALRTLLFLCNL